MIFLCSGLGGIVLKKVGFNVFGRVSLIPLDPGATLRSKSLPRAHFKESAPHAVWSRLPWDP